MSEPINIEPNPPMTRETIADALRREDEPWAEIEAQGESKMHFHRYRPHPELVMWDRCTKCGKDRIGARYHQQRYRTRGQVYTLYAKRPRVMPAGTRMQPPPPGPMR